MNDPNVYPPGWDAERVRKVINYYDSLSDEEWAAEDEAGFTDSNNVVVVIPRELLPAVHKLLAEHSEAEQRNG